MKPRSKRILLYQVVFILVLIVLNAIFGDLDWGIHISVVGSLVLTFVVWGIMAALESGRR